MKTSTVSTHIILAIDLGKYKSVACAYDAASTKTQFDTLTTCRAVLRRLFDRCRPSTVVIESCTLAGWVHDRPRGAVAGPARPGLDRAASDPRTHRPSDRPAGHPGPPGTRREPSATQPPPRPRPRPV